MREIKFRAWVKKEKKMHLAQHMMYMQRNDMKGWIILPKGRGETSWLKVREIELMQYTGLKDKNGKEIYEGDIVVNEQVVSPARVQYKQNKCAFMKTYQDGVSLPIHIDSKGFESIEIIGNIYENKELLK